MRYFDIFEAKSIFSPELDVYHGTNREFDDFIDRPARQPYTPDYEVTGHFFADNPNTASGYASMSINKSGEGKPRIIKARLDLQTPKDITAAIKRYRKDGMSFGEAKRKAHSEVDRSKHDGTIFRGDGLNSAEYVAFTADRIRRV